MLFGYYPETVRMYQSIVGDQIVPEELLWKDTPENKKGDFDYLIEVIDWEANVDPNFAENHFMRPKPVRAIEEMESEGFSENWICYKNSVYSAKELTIFPGKTVTIRDSAAYGLINLQGHGTFGELPLETPALIRFGQLTHDEYFVTEKAAREGVVITNPSSTNPIVMLKHFGPDNPDL